LRKRQQAGRNQKKVQPLRKKKEKRKPGFLNEGKGQGKKAVKDFKRRCVAGAQAAEKNEGAAVSSARQGGGPTEKGRKIRNR